MRKVIKNKLYDTDTAKFIGTYNKGIGEADRNWTQKNLYLKKTGEFFIHSHKAVVSYKDGIGVAKDYSQQIEPLTYTEAKTWAKQYLDAETYKENFEILPEDEYQGTFQVSAFISGEAKQKLDQLRQKTGMTVSQSIEYLIDKI